MADLEAQIQFLNGQKEMIVAQIQKLQNLTQQDAAPAPDAPQEDDYEKDGYGEGEGDSQGGGKKKRSPSAKPKKPSAPKAKKAVKK